VSAKVIWYREAWWMRACHKGRKTDRKIGSTASDKREAQRLADEINKRIRHKEYQLHEERDRPCGAELTQWHQTYSPTFSHSFEDESRRTIDLHLSPFFGKLDLREIGERNLLEYIRTKLDAGLAPLTIQTHLSVLRRVLTLAHRDGYLSRNPAQGLGDLMKRVGRRTATESSTIDAWSRVEIATLLELAEQHEPRFYPALAFLFSTGVRRGELLGLKWEDIDFERQRIHIRRAFVRGNLTTPKSGRGRFIAMPPNLGSQLLDLLGERRREMLHRGWPEVPEWVFPNQTGGLLDQDNFDRSWRRLRRRALKAGVRSFKLHCTRHTWASLALASGKSVKWVADQLGHASPMLTLKTYAHAMREEEGDLSFADFAASETPKDGDRLLYASPVGSLDSETENAPDLTGRGRFGKMEHETGLEPATPTLATWRSTN